MYFGMNLFHSSSPSPMRNIAAETARMLGSSPRKPAICERRVVRLTGLFLFLPIDDGENVAVRILEPGISSFAHHVHVSLVCHSGEVVTLECHSFFLERNDFAIYVLDCPCDRGRLVGSGELRSVDEQSRASALVAQNHFLGTVEFLQSQFAFVELRGNGNVANCDGSYGIGISQHLEPHSRG